MEKPVKQHSSKKEDTKLLWKLHHWSGFYAGIVIGVLCFTGALAVFIPEIDYLIQKEYYSATSSPTSEWKFENSIRELTTQYKDYSSIRVELPDKDGYAGTIHITTTGKRKPEENRLTYFVDMGVDKIVGSRNQQNSIANYMRQIHVRLYESNWGRYLVGLAGVAFVVVTITGFLIYGNFMKRQTYPQIRQRKGWRLLMADWHKILGISALAFNLVIALTGTWLGLQGWFKVKNPAQFKAPIVMEKEADIKTMVKWNEILTSTQHHFPDLMPRYITTSDNGSATITISGNIRGQVYERNTNKLVLSKISLQPIHQYDIRNKPFGHKFYFIQEALHFGDFGGLGLKFLYALLGLVSAFLSISGFVVYFYRTEKKVSKRWSPMKTTFVYSILLLFLLIVVALVSTLIGYSSAAFMMALVVNGTLAFSVVYFVATFILQKKKNRKNPTQLKPSFSPIYESTTID